MYFDAVAFEADHVSVQIVLIGYDHLNQCLPANAAEPYKNAQRGIASYFQNGSDELNL